MMLSIVTRLFNPTAETVNKQPNKSNDTDMDKMS